MNNRNLVFKSSFLCVALATAACAPNKPAKPPEESTAAPAAAASSSTQTPSTGSTEGNLRGNGFTSTSDINIVHFQYDSYALSENARSDLKKNAEYLKAHPELDILAAGSCDERGTIAYNLALGQKRAQAVRDYYMHLGIPGDSIATISYGKEKPLCSESTEDCWAQNRRTETLVRARSAQKY